MGASETQQWNKGPIRGFGPAGADRGFIIRRRRRAVKQATQAKRNGNAAMKAKGLATSVAIQREVFPRSVAIAARQYIATCGSGQLNTGLWGGRPSGDTAV